MTKRPNWTNDKDACCACGELLPTPAKDAGAHEKPREGELHVWQPNPTDPPQWICAACKDRLEHDERRSS